MVMGTVELKNACLGEGDKFSREGDRFDRGVSSAEFGGRIAEYAQGVGSWVLVVGGWVGEERAASRGVLCPRSGRNF